MRWFTVPRCGRLWVGSLPLFIPKSKLTTSSTHGVSEDTTCRGSKNARFAGAFLFFLGSYLLDYIYFFFVASIDVHITNVAKVNKY
jgi:hypothetical protein